MPSENHRDIHMPDLRFSGLCEYLYGINRGVYNTFDYWFCEKGQINIIQRRKVILDFLNSVCLSSCRNKVERKFRFGNGGLTLK
ncbi:MAG: hypothetical protein WD907_03620, partial [Bacilli bacterium]